MADILDDTLLLSIVFGIKEHDDYTLLRGSLRDGLGERIRDEAVKWLRLVVNSELIPYDVGYRKENSEVAFAEIDTVSGARTLISALEPMTAVATFSGEKGFLNSVDLTAIGLTDRHGNQATLLRHVTQSFILGRSGKKLSVIHNEATFDELRQEIVQLDTSYDCVHWGGNIYIYSQDRFERIFDYAHLKIKYTTATLTQISCELPLANPELFISTLSGDTRYQKKIASVFRRGLFRAVPVADLKKLVQERDIPVKFVTNEDGELSIEFDPTPAGRRAFLSLLDDDHVLSELTRRKYEATGKLEWR